MPSVCKHASICPIIYNTLEAYKHAVGYHASLNDSVTPSIYSTGMSPLKSWHSVTEQCHSLKIPTTVDVAFSLSTIPSRRMSNGGRCPQFAYRKRRSESSYSAKNRVA
jgi:hypothetical protein